MQSCDVCVHNQHVLCNRHNACPTFTGTSTSGSTSTNPTPAFPNSNIDDMDDDTISDTDDGWRELQPWDLPENIRQLFLEAGWSEDAIADVARSRGEGDEVPMPWSSDFYGDLAERGPPKAMGMEDGEPVYFDVRVWSDVCVE